MSRIGKRPVTVPDGVEVVFDGLDVTVTGPRGELSETLPEGVTCSRDDDGNIEVEPAQDSRPHRARHGLARTLLANMVGGVTEGYTRTLQLVGVGYRAQSTNAGIELQVGYSHPVRFPAPEGITLEVPQPNQIVVSGIDKTLVGQTAADIRKVRPPEPYKGKGIRYVEEQVRRKAGKTAAGA